MSRLLDKSPVTSDQWLTPMKLAFSTNAFTRHPVVDAIRAIKEAGFAGVEILADTPHAYPDAIDAKLPDTIVKALSETGLAVSNANSHCSSRSSQHAPPAPYLP